MPPLRFLVFLLGFTILPAQARNTDGELRAILASEAGITDLNDRLESVSSPFLNRPYLPNGPLGEGTNGKYDRGPLYRTDQFDCTTFVETTVALARSHSLRDFKKEIIHNRYRDASEPQYMFEYRFV